MPTHKSNDLFKTQIGFVISNLASAQIPYVCISSSNQWLSNNISANISIFYEDTYVPCIAPEFSRFHIKDTALFKGHLINTSLKTLLSTKNAHRCKRYYYINDLEFIRTNEYNDVLESIIKDDNIVKFTRCKDYYSYLTNNGWKINDIIVKDFNINKILEIINNNEK